MTTNRILLVRHPQTEANVTGRFVGRGESPYTELGRRQADELVLAITEWRPDRVYSSPRRRALDVATPSSGCGVPLIVRDGLTEVDFGIAEGMTYAEMTALNLSANHLWMEPTAGSTPVGETWDAFIDRVRPLASEIAMQQGRTAVVVHGGVVRAMVHLLLDVPRESIVRFTIPNATAALLEVDGDWVGLRAFGARIEDLD